MSKRKIKSSLQVGYILYIQNSTSLNDAINHLLVYYFSKVKYISVFIYSPSSFAFFASSDDTLSSRIHNAPWAFFFTSSLELPRASLRNSKDFSLTFYSVNFYFECEYCNIKTIIKNKAPEINRKFPGVSNFIARDRLRLLWSLMNKFWLTTVTVVSTSIWWVT